MVLIVLTLATLLQPTLFAVGSQALRSLSDNKKARSLFLVAAVDEYLDGKLSSFVHERARARSEEATRATTLVDARRWRRWRRWRR